MWDAPKGFPHIFYSDAYIIARRACSTNKGSYVPSLASDQRSSVECFGL
jgi:hypothetical protein